MADIATFRIVFPEFADTASDPQLAYWFDQAPFAQVGLMAGYGFPVGGFPDGCALQNRLGRSYDLAIMLFAAHNIALGLANQKSALKNRAPGATVAPMSSKGAGGLSVGYAVDATTTKQAGIYNATSYGQRLWKLLQQAAMGGTYVAAPPRRTVFGFGNRGLR